MRMDAIAASSSVAGDGEAIETQGPAGQEVTANRQDGAVAATPGVLVTQSLNSFPFCFLFRRVFDVVSPTSLYAC